MYAISNPIDENTWHLKQYEHQQDKLEDNYMSTLEEQYDEILELANLILENDVDDNEFYLAFKEYYNEELDEYDHYLLGTLDLWYMNELTLEDIPIINSFAELALSAACDIITGDSFDIFLDEGCYSLKDMVEELVGEV